VSYIEAGNIEVDSLLGTDPAQTLPITFGSPFSVLPQVSVAVTGFSYYNDPTSPLFSWVSSVGGISQSGATITIQAFSNFSVIQSQWAATQGDTLQLFPMPDLSGPFTPPSLTTTPFNYTANVQFDPSNLPQQVFVTTLLTSYQVTTFGGGSNLLAVIPVYNDGSGLNPSLSAIPYSDLNCSGCTFDPSGIFNLLWQSDQPFTLQYYLFIHRINLPTETPPTTGFFFIAGWNYDSGTQS
jgi:hypothetical protein